MNRFYSLDLVFCFLFFWTSFVKHTYWMRTGDVSERYEIVFLLFNTMVWNNFGTSSSEHGFGFTCKSHNKQTNKCNWHKDNFLRFTHVHIVLCCGNFIQCYWKTWSLNGMRRLMHAFMCSVFLEHTTQAVRACVWVCILHHSNRTNVFCIAYRVSLTFSPSGSNETVIRFTAFRLSNRKFLATADIKPADRLSDPVRGKDISLICTHKNSFHFYNWLKSAILSQNLHWR